jgi:hypothetical protein
MSELFLAEERKRLSPFRLRAMRVMTQFEEYLTERSGTPVRFFDAADSIRFAFWRLWAISERTGVSLPTLFDLLLEKFGGHYKRRKSESILGVPLKTLVGPACLTWIESEVLVRYPDARESNKLRLRLLASLPLQGAGKFSDPINAAEEYAATLGETKKRAKAFQKAAAIRPYRGNPWV